MVAKFFIVVNLHAASGHAKNCLQRTTKYLKQHQQSFEIFSTPDQGAKNLIKNIVNRPLKENQILLIIGGDGTLNQAVNGVQTSNYPTTPLAYLPAGSGNDFARAINLRAHHENQILNHLCHHPTIRTINIGQINTPTQTNYFVNNFGIGFDANIIQLTLNSSWKKRFNKLHLSKLIYVSQAFKAFTQPKFSVQITINDKTFDFNNIFLCVLANQPYFGGGVPLIPPANLAQNSLDLAVAKADHWKDLWKLIAQVFITKNHLQNPAVHYYSVQKAQIKILNSQFTQIDGELLNSEQLSLTITCATQQFWF
ncbi:YegS/Rv2252/BmrU family lipid kinase [Bombilactobacillus folatiphilus]|uniref:YegS/Rv2252/BmrU family lipid kinase n=1 Tax=Bombilactobacillus folatiphilus TaxID=2923362 RepID=A0ABY4PBT5_9LACO|nr:YegS/Rv2252/BmrU family lipid kinase [Bombilactobacillus folatiphilus]UQS82722.1 YegS/Rv2252/BmrU family lipid kinase [Bombilactobacillus folatiphilus]